MGFQLASLTTELTVVAIVVGVLLLASLIALAPLKKLRLPYTVALMLTGFLIGAGMEQAEQGSLQQLAKDILARSSVALLQAPADPAHGDWRNHLDHEERAALRSALAGVPGDADAATVADALAERGGALILHLKHALIEAEHEEHPDKEPGHITLLDQLLHMIGTGGRLSPSMIFFVFLPPLVFESAFNLEVRQLLKNLAPVTVLAVPVLILSTLITGSVVMFAGGKELGLTWEVALLFGALISATDPVAVVALFKDLGAPKRLGVLVEGESLFNDGTAIVLFNILLAMAIASYAPAEAGHAASAGSEILTGVLSFLKVALGGLAVGLLLSYATFALIGKVTSNEHVEISLSVVLAYASFVISEHFLHVSGVMAVVAAGLVAGSYGRTKVSPSVEHFMHSFWEYMGFIMNSLIFFFVGLVIVRQLSMEDVKLWAPVFGATLLGVICARAIGVFGSVPLVHRFVEHIDLRYQTVMFWGGLRGAVSLALALMVFTHPELPEEARKGVLALAAGIVLFTLLVNALTMSPLIKFFGLDQPTPVDRFALAYADLERTEVGEKVLGRLEKEGAVLPSVLLSVKEGLHQREEQARAALNALREEIRGDAEVSAAVAAFVAIALEKGDVLHRFHEGQLTENATKALLGSADVLLDQVKAGHELPEKRTITIGYGRLESRLLSALEPLPLLGALARGMRAQRLGEDIEATRALYLAASSVQRSLAGIEEDGGLARVALAKVQARYAAWKYKAEERLHRLNEEFPEYAAHSQSLLAELQSIRAERHSLHHLAESGLMTEKALAEAKADLVKREAECLKQTVAGIDLAPEKLLRAVPAFAHVDDAHIAELAKKLVSRTFLEGENVVSEGDEGDSMYLIARGAVGVFTKDEQGNEVPLSTLGCGGFFGEIAALLGGTRNATVRAVTPVNLLELNRQALHAVLEDQPELAKDVRDSIYPRVIGRALVDCEELAHLSAEQRTELALKFVEETHDEGATIAEAGAPHRLTYVAAGKVEHGEDTHEDGTAFGVEAFARRPTSTHTTARHQVRLLVLPEEELEAFRKAHPATVDAIEQETTNKG